MSNNAPVQLRQVRDFEQTIGDAIMFMRQNGGVLARCVVVVAALPMVLQGILSAWQAANPVMPDANDPFGLMFDIYGQLFLVLIPSLIGRVLVICVTLEYVRAYLRNEHHGMTSGQLWKNSSGQFWSYLGIWFLSYLMYIVGLILCILPGVYLMTVFVLAGVVHAIERSGVGDGLGRSFKLANANFWPMLGLCAVLALIQIAVNIALALPLTLFSGIEQIFEPGFTGQVDLPLWKVVVSGILTTIAGILEQVVHAAVIIALALRYFSIVEGSQGLGMKEKLEGFDTVV